MLVTNPTCCMYSLWCCLSPLGEGSGFSFLLYCVISTYDMMTSMVMSLSWYLYVALLSSPYLRWHLSELINNRTQSVGKTGVNNVSHSFISPFPFRLVTAAFENFEYPWDVQASTLLLLGLLNVFKVLFRVTKNCFNNTTQRSALRLNSHGWHGMWENMGRYLENFSPPVVWNFTP